MKRWMCGALLVLGLGNAAAQTAQRLPRPTKLGLISVDPRTGEVTAAKASRTSGVQSSFSAASSPRQNASSVMRYAACAPSRRSPAGPGTSSG